MERSSVYNEYRILVREVGVKSAGERRGRPDHTPDDWRTYRTPGAVPEGRGPKKGPPCRYDDRHANHASTPLYCGRKGEVRLEALVNHPTDRDAVLTGENGGQQDFSPPAETVH
jgi:hypothetical protein